MAWSKKKICTENQSNIGCITEKYGSQPRQRAEKCAVRRRKTRQLLAWWFERESAIICTVRTSHRAKAPGKFLKNQYRA